MGEDHVHGDADGPGGEEALVVEGGEACEEFEQGVLGEVGGGLMGAAVGAEHSETDGEEAVLVGIEEGGECAGVA